MALTYKQRRFVDAYIGETNGNATEAARIAGYSDPEQSGWQNKKKVEIQSEIEARYAEKCMASSEVLGRLADQARGVGEFITVSGTGQIALDFHAMKRAGKMHLVHAIKETKDATNIEFYDAQAALVHIGRNLKLFTDRTESDVNVTLYDNLTDAELDEQIAEAEAGKTAPSSPA